MHEAIVLIIRLIFLLLCFCVSSLHALPVTCGRGSDATALLKYEIISKEIGVAHLREIIAKAKINKMPISIKGSGHSQGGHSCNQAGIVLDLSNLNKIELLGDGLVRIQAGATWKQVIEFLNPLGLSIAIMQSDYDFSIGGSVSTNVHGWQINTPPLVSTIYGFHILTAEGKLLYCSRSKHYDLFQAAIGGYGLLGVIIDVDFKVASNRLYELKQEILLLSEFPLYFYKQVKYTPRASMFFGRFALHKKLFLKKLIVRTYEDAHLPLMHASLFTFLNKRNKLINGLFALTYKSQFFKKMRWHIEASNWIYRTVKTLSRNQLLYHSTKYYATKNLNQIDLLQEYFIPINRFDAFINFLQTLEDKLSPHLMNVTLRYVQQDDETLLSYAKEEMLCFVMYFRGPKTEKFDQQLKKVVMKMTDKALELKGSYYLPYRPYQTRFQFIQAYQKIYPFKIIKHKYDPKVLFINGFYKNYLETF